MKQNRDWEAKLAAIAGDSGLEVIEISLQKESAGRFLRVFIDKDGGVDLNDCEAYHKRIIPHLESVEYDYLEVCSPGADRPLKAERDFARNLGKEIEVKLFAPREGQKIFSGRLADFDDTEFSIDTPEGNVSFLKKDVAIARPVIDVETRLRAEDATGRGEEQ